MLVTNHRASTQGVVPNFDISANYSYIYNVSGNDLAGQFTLFQFKSPTKTCLTKLINTCACEFPLIEINN